MDYCVRYMVFGVMFDQLWHSAAVNSDTSMSYMYDVYIKSMLE